MDYVQTDANCTFKLYDLVKQEQKQTFWPEAQLKAILTHSVVSILLSHEKVCNSCKYIVPTSTYKYIEDIVAQWVNDNDDC